MMMMMMIENNSSTGFSSPRCDAFPAGLRVLVVDDDPTWLKILEKMLKKCSYEVTTCGLAREALDLLRGRKDGFDIVISDVNMPDMDGFKLLEHVGLEMDLPVIMMSVDGETSRVMKGVQHGACDYLLKPIRMKELRNIWQHVLRKRIHEVRDIEFLEGMEEIQMIRNGSDQYEDRHLPCASDPISGKKRRDVDYKHDDRDCNDPSSVKKARVVWTVELHQKFVKAVNQIGLEKVGPKKILDLMGVPWLTRENVASHLQKYRLYLGRLQKEKELTSSFGGMKHSDVSAKEPNVTHDIQNLINKQHCDLKNSDYSIHGNRSMMQQNVDFKIHEGDVKCSSIASVPAAEPKKAIKGDNSLGHSGLDVNYGTSIPKQYTTTWDEECSRTQTSLECKPHFQPNSRFNPLPLCTASLNPGFSNMEREKLAEVEMKPAYTKCRSQETGELSAMRNVDLFSAQPVKQTNGQAFKSSPVGLWCMNHNHSLDRILEGSTESAGRRQNLVSGLTSGTLDGNLQCSSLEGEYLPFDIVPESLDSLNYSSPELTAEVPAFLYDSLNFEYPFDPIEYPVIDQGLFIV